MTGEQGVCKGREESCLERQAGFMLLRALNVWLNYVKQLIFIYCMTSKSFTYFDSFYNYLMRPVLHYPHFRGKKTESLNNLPRVTQSYMAELDLQL